MLAIKQAMLIKKTVQRNQTEKCQRRKRTVWFDRSSHDGRRWSDEFVQIDDENKMLRKPFEFVYLCRLCVCRTDICIFETRLRNRLFFFSLYFSSLWPFSHFSVNSTTQVFEPIFKPEKWSETHTNKCIRRTESAEQWNKKKDWSARILGEIVVVVLLSKEFLFCALKSSMVCIDEYISQIMFVSPKWHGLRS